MSLKENISMVKEELSTEEQFFEQAVKTERFVKKYKKPLIGLVVAIGLAVAGTLSYDAYLASKRDAANAAFMTLQSHPDDTKAQQTLKAEAPLLYDAWRMSVAIDSGDAKTLEALSSSPAPEVADISTYEAAGLQKNEKALDAYAYRQEAVYKELALIDDAVLLLRADKVEQARQRLKMIPAESPVFPLATALMHYGVQ